MNLNFKNPSTELLTDGNSGGWPSDWRDDWEFNEAGSPLPQAWHRSGVCFTFEFEQVDEQGNWAWVVMDDDISQSRLEELRAELGDEAFFQPLRRAWKPGQSQVVGDWLSRLVVASASTQA